MTYEYIDDCECSACKTERKKRAADDMADAVNVTFGWDLATPKPRKYEVGDEVDLRVRVTGTPFSSGNVYLAEIVGAGDHQFGLTAKELHTGKLTPRPIKVGDRVSWWGCGGEGTVRAVEDDFCNVVWDNEPLAVYCWYKGEHLERVR